MKTRLFGSVEVGSSDAYVTREQTVAGRIGRGHTDELLAVAFDPEGKVVNVAHES